MRYPVLYLRHGAGQDETGLSRQTAQLHSRASHRLQKILVMVYGYARRAGRRAPDLTARPFGFARDEESHAGDGIRV